LNTIRLLQALVAAGAKLGVPMANFHDIALRDMSLQGTNLASALAYAEGAGWLSTAQEKVGVSLTCAGEVVARLQ
jgi:hypothetical protein